MSPSRTRISIRVSTLWVAVANLVWPFGNASRCERCLQYREQPLKALPRELCRAQQAGFHPEIHAEVCQRCHGNQLLRSPRPQVDEG